MSRGRRSKYDPKYCRDIVSWMSRGFSILSYAGKIGVDKNTLYSWAKNNPEFLTSLNVGKAKSVLFWERIGMLGMMGKIPNFSASTWIFQMKNRLGWSDKLTVDIDDICSETETYNQPKESSIQTMQRLVAKYGKQIPPK